LGQEGSARLVCPAAASKRRVAAVQPEVVLEARRAGGCVPTKTRHSRTRRVRVEVARGRLGSCAYCEDAGKPRALSSLLSIHSALTHPRAGDDKTRQGKIPFCAILTRVAAARPVGASTVGRAGLAWRVTGDAHHESHQAFPETPQRRMGRRSLPVLHLFFHENKHEYEHPHQGSRGFRFEPVRKPREQGRRVLQCVGWVCEQASWWVAW
jgi:hypothetical protein